MELIFAVVSLLLSLAQAAPLPRVLPLLSARQYVDPNRNMTMQNQLTDGTPCRDLTILYARGTGQPGNVGEHPDPGPPFFQAIADSMGADKVAVQGIDYPANVLGYLLGGSPIGTVGMTLMAGKARLQCPDTKIILSGYSQGAQIVHNAAVALGDGIIGDISGIVTFGDPYNKQAKGDFPLKKTKVFCNFSSDKICDSKLSLDDGIAGHLIYGEDAFKAAKFVRGLVGL